MPFLEVPHHVVGSRCAARTTWHIAAERWLGLVSLLMPLETAKLREAAGVTAFAILATFDLAFVREIVRLHVFAVGMGYVS